MASGRDGLTTDPHTSVHQGDGLTIQQVSELLGVPAPTLRSWERRYGLPTTLRTVGGHRRYSSVALQQVQLMRDEIARGQRASDAARSVRTMLDQRELGWIQQFLAASEQMSPAAVREALDQANDVLGLEATIDYVLMPAMRQIGTWWATGRCDVGREHLTTEIVRGWLARLTSLAPAPTSGRPILLACGPRDLHTLGLEALAALLAQHRYSLRVLGARVPQRTLLTATVATDAAAVVLVSHLPTHRRPAVASIQAIAESGCAVYYAGNAFLLPSSRIGVPGTYLGESISTAAARLREGLTPRNAREALRQCPGPSPAEVDDV